MDFHRRFADAFHTPSAGSLGGRRRASGGAGCRSAAASRVAAAARGTAEAQRKQQEASVQQAAEARRQQQQSTAPQNQPAQAADTRSQLIEAPAKSKQSPAVVSASPRTAIAAVPAKGGGPVLGRQILLGIGTLSAAFMAITLVSLMVHRRHARLVPVAPSHTPKTASPPLATRPASVKRRCFSCGRGVRVIGGRAGKHFWCPGCQTVQTITA